jgi:hypothetical protein
MSEYMRRWGVLFRTPVLWIEVFVAYLTTLFFYYALNTNVPFAVFMGLILAAAASIGRILKMELRSRQLQEEQERAASEPR